MFIVKFYNQTEKKKNDLYILHRVLWSDLKPLIHFQTSSALNAVKPFGCFNMSHGFRLNICHKTCPKAGTCKLIKHEILFQGIIPSARHKQ